MTRFPRSAAAVLAAVCLQVSTPSGATVLTTYITGDSPGGVPTIFKAVFDPDVAFSAAVSVVLMTPGISQDGIDFVPGTGSTEVVVGSPSKTIAHFDVVAGTTLPAFVPDTDAVPGAGSTHPSSVLTTPSHFYYVENQFGFGGGPPHRIMRVSVGGGPVEVVADGFAIKGVGPALENFEGIEIVGDRMYFFARDPTDSTKRALMSIGLTPAGLWDGAPAVKRLGGLAASGAMAGPADGADELDFDAASSTLFGTNIVNGEIIYWDVMTDTGGFLITGADIAGSSDDAGLMALSREIDGIRADGLGHLIVTGRGGVLASIDIAGAFVSADDGDVNVLYDSVLAGSAYVFDDLTPMAVPAPASVLLTGLGMVLLRRRVG